MHVKKGDIACEFNQLSRMGRLILKADAFLRGISSIMLEDTKKNPAKFPLYAAFFLFTTTPASWPIPGIKIFCLACAGVGMSIPSRWSRWARGELKKNFNEEAIIEYADDCLVPSGNDNNRYKVKKWELGKKTAKLAWNDMRTSWNTFKSHYISKSSYKDPEPS